MTAARARPAAKRAAKAGAMSAEAVRAHCLSFPHASEVIQWGDHPVFKIAGKMFAVLGSGAPGSNALSFKCADDSFAILTQLPGIVPAPPAWQERLARLVHLALYALMVALPLVGWLAVSAEGRPIALAGVPLPMLIGPDRAWVKPLETIHEVMGQAGYALVGLHAAAALWHHYVIRDNTLALMWPFARAR